MDIYKVRQNIYNDYGMYVEFICVADSEQAARETFPYDDVVLKDGYWMESDIDGKLQELDYHDWVNPDEINKLIVTLVGVSDESQPAGVICANYRGS